jgi:Tfp pilus assembly protein FimT
MTFPNRHRPDAVARRSVQAGFSMIELTLTVSMIAVMSIFAIFALRGSRDTFRSDDQAMRILDFMREAGHRSLAQRQIMRLEVDVTTNAVRIIDENAAGNNGDDRIVRRETLQGPTSVRLVRSGGTNSPPNAVNTPPAPSNYAAATFAPSTHPLSQNNSVCVMRFRPDGTVVDDNNNIVSLSLYMWEPGTSNPDNPKEKKRVRAITVFGGTGGVRLWKYNGSAFQGR